jgi:hypothetical protein
MPCYKNVTTHPLSLQSAPLNGLSVDYAPCWRWSGGNRIYTTVGVCVLAASEATGYPVLDLRQSKVSVGAVNGERGIAILGKQ